MNVTEARHHAEKTALFAVEELKAQRLSDMKQAGRIGAKGYDAFEKLPPSSLNEQIEVLDCVIGFLENRFGKHAAANSTKVIHALKADRDIFNGMLRDVLRKEEMAAKDVAKGAAKDAGKEQKTAEEHTEQPHTD